MGFFRIISNTGGVIGIRHFVFFKSCLIHVESYFLNHNGMTSNLLGDLSVTITSDLYMRKEIFYYNSQRPPAGLTFDVMAFVPSEDLDAFNINK